MKKILVITAALIVIGGLFIFLNHNLRSDSDSKQAENSSSVEASSDGNENDHASDSAQSSSTASSPNHAATKNSNSNANSTSGTASSDTSSSTSDTGQSSQSTQNSTSEETDSTAPSQKTSANQVANRPQGAWVEKFEKGLYKGYHATPSRYKYVGHGLWEVWVKEYNTGEQPYVTVNQYTGNFHG